MTPLAGHDERRYAVHLPIVSRPPAMLPDPSSDSRSEFVALWLGHPEQRRRECVEDVRLTTCAQAHAQELRYRALKHTNEQDPAEDALYADLVLQDPHTWSMHRGYPSSRYPHGSYPNERVIDAGYPLPWERWANYVEATGATNFGHSGMLDLWLHSEAHRYHVFGLNEFFLRSTVYGVGIASKRDNSYAWYVLIVAPEAG